MFNFAKELRIPEKRYFEAGVIDTRLYIVENNVLYTFTNGKKRESSYNKMLKKNYIDTSVLKSFYKFVKTVKLKDPNYGARSLILPGTYVKTRNGYHFLYIKDGYLQLKDGGYLLLSDYDECGNFVSDEIVSELDIMSILTITNPIFPLFSPESMEVIWEREESNEPAVEEEEYDPCENCAEKESCDIRHSVFERYFNEFLENVIGDTKDTVETLNDIVGLDDDVVFTFGKQNHRCYIRDNKLYYEDGREFDTGLDHRNIKGFVFSVAKFEREEKYEKSESYFPFVSIKYDQRNRIWYKHSV